MNNLNIEVVILLIAAKKGCSSSDWIPLFIVLIVIFVFDI